jgi:hypothetical protein
MTHRDLQALTGDPTVGRLATSKHLERFLERHTTLPLRHARKSVEQATADAEKALAADLALAAEALTRAFRAADLLGKNMLGDLHEAERRVSAAQTKLVKERAGE